MTEEWVHQDLIYIIILAESLFSILAQHLTDQVFCIC